MKLRTSVSLIVSLAFLVVGGVLLLDGWTREQSAERRYARTLLDSGREAWMGLAQAHLRQLSGWSGELAGDARIRQALADRDDTQARLTAIESANRLHSGLPDADLEIVGADGRLIYQSAGASAPQLLAGPFLDQTLAAQQPITGLKRLASGDFGLVLGVPVVFRNGPAGAVGMIIDVDKLLPLLSGSDATQTLLVSSDGRAVGEDANAESRWKELKVDLASVPDRGELRQVTAGEHTFAVALAPLTSLSEDAPPILASVHDISGANRWSDLASGVVRGLALALLLLFLGVLHWYLRMQLKPLGGVRRALRDFARGDLEAALPTGPAKDEVRRLVDAAQGLAGALQQLTEDAAARQQTQSEMDTARDIQRRIQPSRFSFPDRQDFELHAVLEPAREIGGGFYDFFLIDDRHLFFMVGDVFNRGVLAALFMTVTKTLLKSAALTSGTAVGAVMMQVNRYLVLNNPTDMFVSVLACVLDLKTGELFYCNSAQLPPVRLAADASVTVPGQTPGIALGIMEDHIYETEILQLQPGDALIVYTNGAGVAIKREGAPAGLISDLAAGLPTDCSAASITRGLLAAIQKSLGSAAQNDDVTLLAVRWWGPEAVGRRRMSDTQSLQVLS